MKIQLLYPDLPVTIVSDPGRIRSCPDIITFPIFIKKRLGSILRRISQIMELTTALGVLCRYHKVSTMIHICCYDVISTLVVTDRRCKDPREISLPDSGAVLPCPTHCRSAPSALNPCYETQESPENMQNSNLPYNNLPHPYR